MRSTSVNLLTPRQMAHQSGWSVKSIRKLLAERRIRHLKRGNRYLIPQNAIDEFLDANMVEPESGDGTRCDIEAEGLLL
ncbi:MAG: helix-turn-helix domain-containing protein [Novosphingobium sp.]|jgi:excisionase family DNA binding protein|nr:helix-turn-helix domain-containing protein [Novosphingobium sp.]